MRAEIADGLRLVRADNPSPFTERGTNTWILGTDRLVVVDPGPDLDTHLAALLAEVRGAQVDAIIVTHAHRDHAGLAMRLAAATGAPLLGFGPPVVSAAVTGTGDGAGGDAVLRELAIDIRLADGAEWRCGAGVIRALHTPGHLGDHLCLLWEDVGFSGDHVMGWSSTVVAPPDGNMGEYMASLGRLEAAGASRLYPGHGDPIAEPARRIAVLRAHRQAREAAILTELGQGPARITAIVDRVYADVPVALHHAAASNVFAHLLDLAVQKRVVAEPDNGLGAVWRRV